MLLRRLSALTFLLLTFGSTSVYAAPLVKLSDISESQTLSQRPGPDRGPGELIQQLNLSTEQMQKMREIKDRFKSQMESRQEALRQAHEEMRSMMSGNSGESEIVSKHQEIESLQREIGKLRLESMLEMRKILTPEQRQKFEEMMKNRRPHFRGGNGPNSFRGLDEPQAFDAPPFDLL